MMMMNLENRVLRESDDIIEYIRNLVVRTSFSLKLRYNLSQGWGWELRTWHEVKMLRQMYIL